MSDKTTPFARWRKRIGGEKPVKIADASKLIGFSSANHATKLNAQEKLSLTVALACAAIEAGIPPVE